MDKASAAEIKELGLTALNGRSANVRKAALLELRNHNQPIVVDVLEQVLQNDTDREVRDLAQNLLIKKRIEKSMTVSSKMVKDPVIANRMPNSIHVWICRFCGGENDDDDKCSHCGALQIQAKPSAASGKPDSDNLFLIDPANRRILDRKAGSSSGALVRLGCVIFVPGFMAIIGLFVLTLIISKWTQFTSLSRLGIVTTGEVTGRDISEDSDGDDTYYVMFRFLADGQEYSERQIVSWERYKSVEVGTRTEIEYVANNPSIAILVGTNQPPIFMTGFGICWNAFVWAIIIGLVHANRRDNQLKREGQLIRGQVVTAAGKSDSDNDYVITMEYAFKAPETNRLIIGTQRKIRNDLDKTTLPKAGTPVAVLFRNEKHHMAL